MRKRITKGNDMGRIIISSNVTLDGVVQDPDGEEGSGSGGWFHRCATAKDLEGWVARETGEALSADALLLGRRSSEWFADRMLSRDDADIRVSPEWADRVKSLPKYIVSSTLVDARCFMRTNSTETKARSNASRD